MISVTSEKDIGSCFKFTIQNHIPVGINDDEVLDSENIEIDADEEVI